jgi:acyl-CoA thioester hydrolase
MRDRLQKLRCEAPAHGAPRSIDVARAGALATTARADALGAPIVGRGLVSPDQTDAFGRMRAEFFIGRVSDSVPNLMAQWRAEAVRETGLAAPGAAVLEYRLLPRAWPRAGDLIEVRSGVVDVTEKTQRLVHWLLDPISGEAWCTAEAVAVTFDLQTRKTIAPPPAHRAALMARALPGWTI